MYKPEELRQFYQGKKVLVTGHTGFKGQWLSLMLSTFGAKVIGFSNTQPSINFNLIDYLDIHSVIGDVRDLDHLKEVVKFHSPNLIIHLAAETLVIESYSNPVLTWETNVIGSVNLLESVRVSEPNNLLGILIVTTDKVYKNLEKISGYSETDLLGGTDPYSASKSAVEILVDSWRKSYVDNSKSYGIATARAGNVIGGGDWNENRLIPDFFRAVRNGSNFELRNPDSVRPWQHVLDVSYGYLSLLFKLSYNKSEYSSSFNFGPVEKTLLTTNELINLLNENSIKIKINYKNKSKQIIELVTMLKY